ncbi:MAG: hypothetical protein Q27BPR15_03910 [Rhodobacter sp. CACIA14H1]|nr:MAG: hypothetical protein Q27BPR15_03910 [Rhodobacter sp. CACIA14H1]
MTNEPDGKVLGKFSMGTPNRAQLALLKRAIICVLFLLHIPAVLIAVSIAGCQAELSFCLVPDADNGPDGATTTAGAILYNTGRVVYFTLEIVAKDYTEFSATLGFGGGIFAGFVGFLVSQNTTLVRTSNARMFLIVALLAGFCVSIAAQYLLTSDTPISGLGFSALGYLKDRFGAADISVEMISASLTGFLQFLRLCDALLIGASLGLLKKEKA